MLHYWCPLFMGSGSITRGRFGWEWTEYSFCLLPLVVLETDLGAWVLHMALGKILSTKVPNSNVLYSACVIQ